jgi:hypothetical protein
MHFSGQPESQTTKANFESVKIGFKFLIKQKIMWSSMLLDTLSVLFASCVVLMPIFAHDILRVGPAGLGFLYSAPAVGAVILGTFLARGIHIEKQGAVLLWTVAIYAIAIIIFGLSKSFVISLLALSVVGASNLVSVTIRSVIRQTFTPTNMMGRLYSFYSFFWIAGDRIGDIEAGFLAQLIGAPLTTVFGGVIALGVVGLMTLLNPTLRHYSHKP